MKTDPQKADVSPSRIQRTKPTRRAGSAKAKVVDRIGNSRPQTWAEAIARLEAALGDHAAKFMWPNLASEKEVQELTKALAEYQIYQQAFAGRGLYEDAILSDAGAVKLTEFLRALLRLKNRITEIAHLPSQGNLSFYIDFASNALNALHLRQLIHKQQADKTRLDLAEVTTETTDRQDFLQDAKASIERSEKIYLKDLGLLPEGERARRLVAVAQTLGLSARFEAALRGAAADPKEQFIEWGALLSEKDLRKKGKELWSARAPDDPRSVVQFIFDNYGDRMGRGFNLADLRKADPGLCRAYKHWLSKPRGRGNPPTPVPAGFYMPTEDEWNDRCISQFQRAPETVPKPEQARILLVMATRARRGTLTF